MNLTNKITAGWDRYGPLFQESEMYQSYHRQLKESSAGDHIIAGYQNIILKNLPFQRSDSLPQTVEDVIQRGYFAVPNSEPEIAIISDKKHTSWLGLDDVIHQIRSRYMIYHRNFYDLELAKCAATNALHTHEAESGGPADSKQKYSLNKRLDKFYFLQQQERVNLWQDVSRLKLQLPENAQNYLSAYRKVSILEDKKGDAL
jgi:hypothetical protein